LNYELRIENYEVRGKNEESSYTYDDIVAGSLGAVGKEIYAGD